MQNFKNMKLYTTILFLLLGFSTAIAQEQNQEEEKKFTFAVDVKHNSAAGFYPVFLGFLELDDKKDITVYSIFWTNPNFGTINSGGNLFLETGVGLGFKANNWYINPSLGIGHGRYLAGGTETLLAEGLIPNVFTLFNKGKFEFEMYLAYYKSLREGTNADGSTAVTRDFFLNWIVPGYKLNKNLSVGAYYEQYIATRASQEALTGSLYQWLGGYVKFSMGNKYWLRLAAGANVADDVFGLGGEFYKMNVFIPFGN